LLKVVAQWQQIFSKKCSIDFSRIERGHAMGNWAAIRAIGIEFTAVVVGMFIATVVLWMH
jgi:hypothetical protein